MKWENRGDVDFFEMGRIFLSEGSGVYDAITCDPLPDEPDDMFLFSDGAYIDVSDDWMDLDAIHSTCGNWSGNAELASFALDFYGPANFGGSEEILSRMQVMKRMESSGIEMEPKPWRYWLGDSSSTVVSGEYVSVWDSGIEIHSECSIDTSTMSIKGFGQRWVEGADIEEDEIDDVVEHLDEEYVDIYDGRYTVAPRDEDVEDIYGRGIIWR